MFFMLFEVGSHLSLDHHEHDADGEHHAVVSVEEHEHEHGCDVYMECVDHEDEDTHLPNPQDQSTHHDVLVSSSVVRFVRAPRYDGDRLRFEPSTAPRPISFPPFHPPKA